MQKPAVLVAIVVLIAAGVAIAFTAMARGDVQPAPEPQRPEIAAAAGSASSVAIDTSNPDAVPTAGRAPAQPVFDGPAGMVKVVRGDTGAAVEGASVWFVPPKATSDNRTAADADDLVWVRRVGMEVHTAGDGTCTVGLGDYGNQVWAVHGDLYAEGFVPRDAKEPTVLALFPDRTLHVLVVDAAGIPAGGVAVEVTRGDTTYPLRRTDGNGRTERMHCQTLLGDRSAVTTMPTTVNAHVPGAASEAAQVDLTSPPAELVLHLPGHGSVTVHLLDVAGAPIDPRYLVEPKVRLAAFVRPPDGPNQLSDGFRRDATEAEVDANGDARFARVGLDRHMAVQFGFLATAREFTGPTAVSPHVEVTLQESNRDAIVTGRILGPQDVVFAEATLRYDYARSGSRGSGSLRTDADGRFRCNLGTYPIGDAVLLGFQRPQRNSGPGDEPLAVELPVRPLHAGITDLGDVRLQPLTRTVTGTLAVDPGAEVPRVSMRVERESGGRWEEQWNLVPMWFDDGHFEVRSGIPIGTPLRLNVRQGAFLPVPPIEFAAGAKDVVVTLHAAGELTASFLLPATTVSCSVQAHLRNLDPSVGSSELDAGSDVSDRLDSVDGRAARRWVGLTPGDYELTVRCTGSAAPLRTISPLHVTGGRCDDPRLVDIDLRAELRTFAIRVLGPDGTPITDFDAFVILAGTNLEWTGYNLRTGVATVTTAGPVDIAVVAPGCKTLRAEGVGEARTLQLEAAAVTEFVLDPPLAEPLGDGERLGLRLLPRIQDLHKAYLRLDTGRSMPASSFFQTEAAFGADGRATVAVRWQGDYDLHLTFQAIGGRATGLAGVKPARVTLPATGSLGVGVSAKDIEAARQRR